MNDPEPWTDAAVDASTPFLPLPPPAARPNAMSRGSGSAPTGASSIDTTRAWLDMPAGTPAPATPPNRPDPTPAPVCPATSHALCGRFTRVRFGGLCEVKNFFMMAVRVPGSLTFASVLLRSARKSSRRLSFIFSTASSVYLPLAILSKRVGLRSRYSSCVRKYPRRLNGRRTYALAPLRVRLTSAPILPTLNSTRFSSLTAWASPPRVLRRRRGATRAGSSTGRCSWRRSRGRGRRRRRCRSQLPTGARSCAGVTKQCRGNLPGRFISIPPRVKSEAADFIDLTRLTR